MCFGDGMPAALSIMHVHGKWHRDAAACIAYRGGLADSVTVDIPLQTHTPDPLIILHVITHQYIPGPITPNEHEHPVPLESGAIKTGQHQVRTHSIK